MEIKIPKAELLKGLGLIQGVVERKTTMAILNNALLRAKNKTLSVIATDLEVGVSSLYPAEVISQGEVVVHARTMYDIARELPASPVHITVGGENWIEIKCDKSNYRIMGLSSEEYPALPQRGEGDLWKMDSLALTRMIDKTAFAMSQDAARFNINGIYLEPVSAESKKSIGMVATDGHRLSISLVDAPPRCGLKDGVIIPRKGVVELKKMIEGETAEIDLWCSTKYLMAYKDNVSLVIRLVDGQFPPYAKIIPQTFKHVVPVVRNDLIHALKRVSVLSTDRASGVRVSISPKNIDIFASNPDMGESREEIETTYRGETFEVCFNAKYVLEALDVIEDEQAVLQLGDQTEPLVLRSEHDMGFTHVIMPMRI